MSWRHLHQPSSTEAAPPDITAELIAAVAPEQGRVTSMAAGADGIARASTHAGHLTVPLDATGALTLLPHDPSTAPVTLGLPLDTGAAAATADDGTLVYRTPGADPELAVQVMMNGGLRLQSIMHGAASPRAFPFGFGADVVDTVRPD
ncbi:MAG: hypothetical protein ACT4RN_07620 [Pseudonocardia sp.]